MKTLFFSLFLSFFFAISSSASTVNLNQDSVLKLTEKQAPEVLKLRNLRASQEFLYAQATAELDFNLSLTAQKRNSRFRSTSGINITSADTDVVNAQLSKQLSTGTSLSVSAARTGLDLKFDPTSTPSSIDTTEDVFTFGISQDLWSNFFGERVRANRDAAQAQLSSAAIQTELQFEAIVLQNLQLFWRAVSSKKVADETQVSLSRYSNLVSQIKRKSSFGTAQTGELSQVQAEFEAQRSALKAAQDLANSDLENLKTALNLSASETVTLSPRLPPQSLSETTSKIPDVSKLRRFKILELEKTSALASSKSRDSQGAPQLSAFMQYGTQGLGNDSLSQASQSKYPETTVGLRYSQTFGSGFNQKLKAAAHAEANTAQIDFNLSVQKLNDRALALNESLKTAAANYNSVVREREFRLKAASEYTRAYNQGRVDIQNLIQVLNATSNIEAQLARAQGQYEVLLLEWKYFSDTH